MRGTQRAVALFAIVFMAVSSAAPRISAEPPANAKKESPTKTDRSPAATEADEERVTVDVARQRAQLMHNICSAMLDVMHHQYFREERSTVPATAMEDAFRMIAAQEQISARWITVNAKVMNVDHEPKDEFEKQAAKAIAAGEIAHELVEEGVYRRAQGISLMNKGCLQCHLGFGASGRRERFAGLVLEIAVSGD
jgi:hypothetical protein